MDPDQDVREPEKAANPNETWKPDPNEVARRAYFYYEARGYAHGLHEDDWHRAEQECHRLRASEALTPQVAATTGEGTQRTSPWPANELSASGIDAGSPSATARTVVGVFHSMRDAQRAFDDLHAEGFSRDEISLVANQSVVGGSQSSLDSQSSSEVAADAGIGAAVGGVGGLLVSLAAMAIPGVGPVLATGPLIAALGGAGLGAAAGGLIGALTERGVPEDIAGQYAEGVRRGDVILTVNATGERADRAVEILDRDGAVDLDQRVSAWRKRGWAGYDANAHPMTKDELQREREYFQLAEKQGIEWSRDAAAESPRSSRVYAR